MSTNENNVLAEDFSITRHKSPYPGLRPFLEDEPDLFFGRDKQITDIIERLGKNNVAAILGGSGCGKSSLVRAGVIPELRTYGIPNHSDTWVPVTFTPGEAPIARLAKALNRSLNSCSDDNERKGRIEKILQAPQALSNFFKKYKNDFHIKDSVGLNLGERANLLVLIDQFEEVFRPQNTAPAQTQQLINLVTECFEEPHRQVYLILTMRSEFLDRCANYPKFADVLNEVSYLTRRLEVDELKTVIIQPARRYAATLLNQVGKPLSTIEKGDFWPFEESVKKQLVQDVDALHNDTDHLPLLQHYLFWLWRAAFERWDTSGKPSDFSITEADMERAVGIACKNVETSDSSLRDSLNNHAQAIYDSLDKPAGQQIAENMFRLLAKVDEKGIYTRRWTSKDVILRVSNSNCKNLAPEEVGKVLEKFLKPHAYLREYTPVAKEENIDVAHEAFIRNWSQFKKWLILEKEARDVYLNLVEEFNKGTNPLKKANRCRWCLRLRRLLSSNRDLLSNKEIDAVDRINLSKLGPDWARRYNEEYYNGLIARGKLSRKPDPIDHDELYRQSVAYFRISKTSVGDKKKAIYIALPLLIILSIWGYNSKRETDFTQREMNALQPYIVVNALRGPPSDQPEWIRPIRFLQLAVASRSMEMLENEMVQKKKAYTLAEERMQRLKRIWRLARSAIDSSVRTELIALVPSTYQPTNYTDYKTPPHDVVSDRKCVDQVLEDYAKTYNTSPGPTQNIRLEMATADSHKSWMPLLIRLGSEFLLGVKHNNTCSMVSRAPTPPNVTSLYHDDSLQLMIWNVGYSTVLVDRIHWFSNPPDKKAEQQYNDYYRQYQIDYTSLGQIESDPNYPLNADSIQISSKGKGFTINSQQGKKYYEIQRLDSLEPVHEGGDKIKPDIDSKENFSIASQGEKILYRGIPVDEVSKNENAIFTSYAYQRMDDNTGYLVYIAANKLSRDIQTMTLLKFDKSMFEKEPKDVRLELAKFTFRRPPITKITFGKDTHEGWLFFTTEEGDIYRTIFGMKQIRTKVCDILEDLKVDDTQVTKAYQILKKNEEGFIYKIMNEGGPCPGDQDPTQSGVLLADKRPSSLDVTGANTEISSHE